jgi:hypothetical protein
LVEKDHSSIPDASASPGQQVQANLICLTADIAILTVTDKIGSISQFKIDTCRYKKRGKKGVI